MNYDAEYRTTSQSSYSLTVTSSTSSRPPLHSTRAEGKTPRTIRPDHARTFTTSVSIVTDLQSEDMTSTTGVFPVVSAKTVRQRDAGAIPLNMCNPRRVLLRIVPFLPNHISIITLAAPMACAGVRTVTVQRQNMVLNVHRNHTAY